MGRPGRVRTKWAGMWTSSARATMSSSTSTGHTTPRARSRPSITVRSRRSRTASACRSAPARWLRSRDPRRSTASIGSVTLPFNVIDAAILALLGFSVWNGYRSGFIATAYGLATWIVSFAAAVVFQSPAASLVEKLGLLPATARPLGFVIVIVVVEGLFSLAGYFALTPIVRTVHRASPWALGMDKALGIFPSVLRSLFVVGIVLAAIVVSPLPVEVKAAIEGSRISRALIERVTAIQPQLAALSGQLGDNVPLFVTKLGADDTEKLDLPSDLQLAPDPVAERQMFDLVNDERTSVGLRALEWDDRLVPVARAHSE